MVDVIYGRGVTDILREMPYYISIFKKMAMYRLFHVKQPMYGSVERLQPSLHSLLLVAQPQGRAGHVS
jgi:hypothetical protein